LCVRGDSAIDERAHVGEERLPVVLHPANGLFAEVFAPLRERLELFLRVVAMDHGHDLHGFDQMLDVVALAREMLAEGLEPSAQRVLLFEELFRAREVSFDERERARGLFVEDAAHLFERESERGESLNAREPRHVDRAVEPVSGRRAFGGHEQIDRLVMMERANGDARTPREFTDLVGRSFERVTARHDWTVRPHVA
jgi:hypothetical protein